MQTTDTILIGATYYAVGYAYASERECLILDKRSVVGADFSASLVAEPCPNVKGEFADLLKSKGILNEDGRIHIVPCAAELGKFIVNHKLNVLLETEILSVIKVDSGFEVTVFNRDGMGKIFAKNVINTEGVYAEGSSRTLGAVLVNGTSFLSVPKELGYIQYERDESEPIFHLNLGEKDDMVTAREKMRLVIDEGNRFGDWQIAAVASEIAWHYDRVVRMKMDDGTLNVSSASFGDIISAMEGGVHNAISDNN